MSLFNTSPSRKQAKGNWIAHELFVEDCTVLINDTGQNNLNLISDFIENCFRSQTYTHTMPKT